MKREANWYGLNMLPVYDEMLAGQLDASLNQMNSLARAQSKPHVLDSDLVSRIIKSHTKQNDDIWVYIEQRQKWRDASPSADELKMIALIEKNAARLEKTNKDIIAKACSFQDKTIDTVLSKTDIEAGLDWLLSTCSTKSQNK